MRLFLALDLPKEAKRKLAKQVEGFQKEYPYFRWVSEENYHITLQFFGDQFDPKFLIKKIGDALYDSKSFYLYSLHGDLFLRHKVILHLTFQRNKELESIVSKIQNELGMESARKFVPHLTLGRYKIPSKQQYLLLKKKLKNLKLDIEFKTSELVLFDSILETPKPLYEKVAEFPLHPHTKTLM